ncbi:MAG: cytochrome c oxidase accessory protein CcoG [Myxococcales bacterium FL481]|nr:MAG: cytochrome c oxidase accessory protein CcoG [Myxococcales bacterium FL481]
MPLAENDRMTTIGEGGARIQLYPKWFRGRRLTWRTWVHGVLVALLLVGPWIDVGGHPAIRIDIPGRRLHFWGATLLATDGAYLLFFLLGGALTVFLFTALFGRAWCGWSCPQTVFLESIIRPIERWLEGDAQKRRAFDNAPWTPRKAMIRAIKLGLFLIVCGALGTTAVAYFLGREGVLEAQADPLAHPTGTAIFIFITAVTFLDFAWFREQVCTVVCPYGRWQSVLLDAHSLTVGYDPGRGEPRGKAKDPNAGDCVDCKKCVQVCPTGIDIRKGTQMECVQCMACIDACDDIMVKLKRPKGLIRFTSERELAGQKTKVFRSRVVAYALALAGVIGAMTFSFAERQDVTLNLGRQPKAPYAFLPDGRVQNSLRLRVSNRGDEPRNFDVRLVSPADGELVIPIAPFVVKPEEVKHVPVFLLQAATAPAGRMYEIEVHDDHGFQETVSIAFVSAVREEAP